MSPPVAPTPRLLPFHDPSFSWDTFECFFCDFLAARPELIAKDGTACRVVTVSLYGRRGDSQHGIDILAQMSNQEIWAFQCKHYRSWGPEDTRDAIAKCTHLADRKFLLITRPISPECREIINEHSEWVIWDSHDISREFLARLSPTDAARLLHTNFGPGWSQALVGLPGTGPLLTAEARFAAFLEAGRSFHHRLDLVGRREWLKDLDDFIDAESLRVFLIVGRGGIGKSRLLREWSRGFSERHKSWTLRFVSDSVGDFAPALDGTSRPLVLVFDDAHRLDEVRRALFAELPSRKDIKLVLSLRPGPVSQVEAELIAVGFDVTQIQKHAAMERLTSEQALQLAESALGAELSDQYRLRLRDLSRDCPLLAVLAAELLKRGELAAKAMDNTGEFRAHVFEGLLSEARAVTETFGAIRTRDFLRILALLGPVKIEAEFLKSVAIFLGNDTKPNHVMDMLAAVDQAGLLLTTGAGVRVTPDLLSDHLAYTACYDTRGRDTTFGDRVLAHFAPDKFPRLMQHLAEAEWHAQHEHESAESVVEPLWKWFLARFEAGSFYTRRELLNVWANIAHVQPLRTLELAEYALRLDTAVPAEKTWFRGAEWDPHRVVLNGLPSLLKPLAETHPGHVSACLDILWKIGRDRTVQPIRNDDHPISTISKIANYGRWKSLDIQRQVLTWIKGLINGKDWTNYAVQPGWLLSQLLNPFFATSLDETWSSGRTLHWRSLAINLGNTIEFRNGALEVCRSTVDLQTPILTLAVLQVLEHALRRARIGNDPLPDKFEENWLVERRKALVLAEHILTTSNNSVVHFRVRQILLHQLQYDDTDLRSECRELFNRVPDTLDLRLIRSVVGEYFREFERPFHNRPTDWQEEAKRRWDQFVRTTANELLIEYQTADRLFRRLAECQLELLDLGFRPNYRDLLCQLSEVNPGRALQLAECLIQNPSHALALDFDTLVLHPTKADLARRLGFCQRAIETQGDEIRAGAIGCFTWWRRDGELPHEAWELILECAHGAGHLAAHALVRFVWLNDATFLARDWEILAAIPLNPADFVVHELIGRAAHLIEHGHIPSAEVATKILSVLEWVPSLGDHDIEHGLKEFGKHFPGKVFTVIWRRHQLRKKGDANLEVVPFDFEQLHFSDIRADPDAADVIAELENRLLNESHLDYRENQILQMAIMQSGDSPEPHLLRLIERASTGDQLERITDFARTRHSWPIVLECPDFTKAILVKARSQDGDCYSKIFAHLQSFRGGRGFTGGGPTGDWKALIECSVSMAEKYATDPELGEFYLGAAKYERDGLAEMQRHSRAADENLDDF